MGGRGLTPQAPPKITSLEGSGGLVLPGGQTHSLEPDPLLARKLDSWERGRG